QMLVDGGSLRRPLACWALVGQKFGFESVCEEPHPACTYRVRRVHPQASDGRLPHVVFGLNCGGLVVWREDEVEACVPVVDARIEQAYWLITRVELHGLSGAFREIAPKAGQREIIEIVGPTGGQRDDVLNLKFLSR